jgi:hypothetical protein
MTLRLHFLFSIVLAFFFTSIHPQLAAEPTLINIQGSGFGPMKPAVSELDGDLTNGSETVVTTLDGTIQALNSTGAVLWAAQTPNRECAATPIND